MTGPLWCDGDQSFVRASDELVRGMEESVADVTEQ